MSEVDLLFVTVTVCGALVVPTATLPKFRLPGKAVTGTIPVPESGTVCGLFDALSVMVSDAGAAAPTAVGLKLSTTVQLAPAATVGLKHVDEGPTEYGDPGGTLREVTVSEVVLLFVTVTVCVALVVPAATLPKFRLPGATATCTTPVPESGTVCGLFAALSVMDSVPGCAPSAAGVSVRPMLHESPAPNAPGLGHVVDAPLMAYGLPAPSDSEVIFIDTNPLFVSLTVFTALALPIATLPKFSETGVSVVVEISVACRSTICGLLLAVLVMVSLVSGIAGPVGVTVRVMVQVALAASALGVTHLVGGGAAAKAKTLPAGSVMEVRLMEPAPAFLRVMVTGELVVPPTTLPKFTGDAGVTVVCAAAKAEENRLNNTINDGRKPF